MNPGPRSADDLLALALARPAVALARARALLASEPDPVTRSVARQTIGIVLRDRGEVGAAIRELRTALRWATRAGDPGRRAEVLASLGAALALAGRTAEGDAAFEAATGLATGTALGRILVRRGGIRGIEGRHEESIRDLTRAASVLRRTGDALWEARAVQSRALSHLARGAVRRAEADLVRAEALFARTDQDLERCYVRHNRGLAAYAAGDLPTSLALLAEAADGYTALDAPLVELAIDRSTVLLAAGLAAEALELLVTVDPRDTRMAPALEAELSFATGRAALAAGDLALARRAAALAGRRFAAQGRPWWAARSRHLAITARAATGELSERLLRAATANADALVALRVDEAVAADIVAGRLATGRHETATAVRHLRRAARARRHPNALTRSLGWTSQALAADAAGATRAKLGACRRGLDALDDHILTMGDGELRAHATAHGATLVELGLRHATRHGDARATFAWAERWRGIAYATGPEGDRRELTDPQQLAALRDVTLSLERARSRQDDLAVATLARERTRLERLIRDRSRQARGGSGERRAGLDLTTLRTALGDRTLLQVTRVDDALWTVTVDRRGARLRRVGPAAAAERELVFALSMLRRLAHGSGRFTEADLVSAGRRLEAAVLGESGIPGDGPVVVVPPARLSAMPWSLCPGLSGRPVSMVPSAGAFVRAARQTPPRRHTIALVAGPDLGTGGREVSILAPGLAAGSAVLTGPDATAEAALDALDGRWLAHVAAHGEFRADNPMFSSLRLANGPLTVHDITRLRHAPYRLLLSACDSGVGAAVGADEILGFVGALQGAGTAGALASVCIVNDEATVPFVLGVHLELGRGADLAEAAWRSRAATGDDPVAVATGAAYVAMGV